jgi:hypothetical protein
MSFICKIDSALTTFERVNNAVMLGSTKPAIKGALCSIRQNLPNKFRLVGQFNRVPLISGFVVSAVIHAIEASLNRLLGRKDRLNRLPAQIPRSGKLSDYTSLQVQKRASPTCNRTEQLPMVSVAGNSGTS